MTDKLAGGLTDRLTTDEKKKMKDFFYTVKAALNNCTQSVLLKKYNGDPNIILDMSHDVITIDPEAFYELKNHSMASIIKEALRTQSEVAFTGIIDERNLHICEFVRGETGNWDGCDWDEGDLLPNSYEKALDQGKKVSQQRPLIVLF